MDKFIRYQSIVTNVKNIQWIELGEDELNFSFFDNENEYDFLLHKCFFENKEKMVDVNKPDFFYPVFHEIISFLGSDDLFLDLNVVLRESFYD